MQRRWLIISLVVSIESCHTQSETQLPISHQQANWAKEHKRLVPKSTNILHRLPRTPSRRRICGAVAIVAPRCRFHSFSAAGHIDQNGKAELIFSETLAGLKTAGGSRVPNVVYNSTNNICAASYCHGNWALRQSQSKDVLEA